MKAYVAICLAFCILAGPGVAASDTLVNFVRPAGELRDALYWTLLENTLCRTAGDLIRYCVVPSAQLGEVCIGLKFDGKRNEYVLTRRAASKSIYYCIHGTASDNLLPVDRCGKLPIKQSSVTLDKSTAECLIELWSRELAKVSPAEREGRAVTLDGPTQILAQRNANGQVSSGEWPDEEGPRLEALLALINRLDRSCLLGGKQGSVLAKDAVDRIAVPLLTDSVGNKWGQATNLDN